LQQQIIDSEKRLLKVRELMQRRKKACIINIKNARQYIQNKDQFKDSVWELDILVSDASKLPFGLTRPKLKDYMKFKKLHMNLVLILLGIQRGGKSEIARYIGFTLSYMYRKHLAQVVRNDTIEVLKDVADILCEGDCIILDEFDMGSAQLVHCDANLIKAFFAINTNQDIRARNKDLSLVKNIMKILTSNAESPEQWAEALPTRGHHKAAIMERAVFCTFTEKQWKNATAPDNLAIGLPQIAQLDEAESAMNAIL
jgi:hypothetical protein